MPARGPHDRQCHDCGNVAIHMDNVVPHVICQKCGSQDTRLVRMPKISPAPPPVGKGVAAKTTTSLKISAVNISIEGDAETIQEGLQAFRDLFSALGSIGLTPTE